MPLARKASIARLRPILNGVDLFSMFLGDQLDRVIDAGELRMLPPGAQLFGLGDQADELYVVVEGVLRVSRTPADETTRWATVGCGEVIGGVSLVTGRPRGAAVRVGESPAVVWCLGRSAFHRLLAEVPGYAIELAKALARRVENMQAHLHRRVHESELSGRLAHFDLVSVLQTLIATSQSGVLSIQQADGRTVARVLIEKGTVSRARYGHLHGEDAVQEILLHDEVGTFLFRSRLPSHSEEISPEEISAPSIGLIMDAMRRKDELPRVQARLPAPDVRFRRASAGLTWTDPATEAEAREVHRHLKEPRTADELAEWVPFSTLRLHELLARMYEAGQIL